MCSGRLFAHFIHGSRSVLFRAASMCTAKRNKPRVQNDHTLRKVSLLSVAVLIRTVFTCVSNYLMKACNTDRNLSVSTSIRPSFCTSHAETVSKRFNLESRDFHHMTKQSGAVLGIAFFCGGSDFNWGHGTILYINYYAINETVQHQTFCSVWLI